MSTHSPIVRVLLVDDSALVRQGIKWVLSTEGKRAGIAVAGEAETVADAIAKSATLKPDVVLLDIRLPDGSGLEACREICKQPDHPKVLVLTSHISDALMYESITAGAEGYLMKEIDPAHLVDSIRRAAEGATILSPELTSRVLGMVRASSQPDDTAKLALLSPQEKRVLALVAGGRTNKEIGVELGLSDNTVKNYLGSVFEKLEVKRRSQAAALWVKVNPR